MFVLWMFCVTVNISFLGFSFKSYVTQHKCKKKKKKKRKKERKKEKKTENLYTVKSETWIPDFY